MCAGQSSSLPAKHNLRLALDPSPDARTQEPTCAEVHPPPQDLREFRLQVEEAEPRRVPRFKVDEHVNVALRLKIFAEDRPEQGQPPDVVTPAKPRNLPGRR